MNRQATPVAIDGTSGRITIQTAPFKLTSTGTIVNVSGQVIKVFSVKLSYVYRTDR
jgi:hypothetical protein